jgi:hypothetical protein
MVRRHSANVKRNFSEFSHLKNYVLVSIPLAFLKGKVQISMTK